ncbi:MAG TPA: type I secretion system permease/ATPase [Methylococcaceae bacterium]|nr:type I secretion system permease/ATPase [Methylococcaceae bacterium]
MKDFILAFKPYFLYTALFSFFLNILQLTMPIYMLQVFDRVFTSRSETTLAMLTIAALAMLLFAWVLEMVRSRLLICVSEGMDLTLGERVLGGLLLNASRLENRDYVSGLRDVAVIRGFLTGQGIFALYDSPWFPFYLLIIFLMHPMLGGVALVSAVVLIGLALSNERATRAPLDAAGRAARVSGRSIDAALRNAEVISAMGMLPEVRRRWQTQNRQVLQLQRRANLSAGIFTTLTKETRIAIQVVTMATGAWLVVDQNLTPGIMMAATLLLGRALAPVEMAVGTWRQFAEARQSYRNLADLLERNPEPPPQMDLPSPSGRITAERVVFSARSGQPPIIKGVSFELLPGEVLGMIGPSAAGKSTLSRLITGVWRPTSGAVRFDGADIAIWKREQVGRYIGYLPQDVELFSGTVAENIARLADTSQCHEEIVRAAQLAGIHDMVLGLPNGYDTEIGEGGSVLSGGQKQRIALARAIFGDPRLVVLDEPNANLDAEGEAALARALQALKEKGATVVVISHRPGLLARVDKIMILRNGVVEQFGTRDEVMAKLRQPALQAVQKVRA